MSQIRLLWSFLLTTRGLPHWNIDSISHNSVPGTDYLHTWSSFPELFIQPCFFHPLRSLDFALLTILSIFSCFLIALYLTLDCFPCYDSLVPAIVILLRFPEYTLYHLLLSFPSLNNVLQRFCEVFKHPEVGRNAGDKLLALWQEMHTVAEFALSFRTLEAQTVWVEYMLKLLLRKRTESGAPIWTRLSQ